MSCTTFPAEQIDIQGHRGCRGLMPENTIPGFIKAIDIGVNTLEMDVVISKDGKVLVSHEPFLSHQICLTPEGKEIAEEDEKSYNLFEMNYKEIKRCDCGTKNHPGFPDQDKMKVYKPLLSEVIDTVKRYIKANGLPPVQYNIEIKCTPEGDGAYHPEPAKFVDLVVDVIKEKGITGKTIIQSFDVRTLQGVRQKYPEFTIALLVENAKSPEDNIRGLGFVPDIYSPNYFLINADLIKYGRKNNMKIIPWTINEKLDMKKVLELGVDGIITDYPDRAMEVVW